MRRGYSERAMQSPALLHRGLHSHKVNQLLVSRGLKEPMKQARIAVAVALFCGALQAQSDRGAITGTITDPAGAVIPSAPVQVRNVETGAAYDVGASATGNYVVQVPAGTYELTVSAHGFKRYVRQNLAVPVAQTLRIDVTLEVGSNAESVTVTELA